MEMTKMAKDIVLAGVAVPTHIMRTTRSVIRLRQRSADFHASIGGSEEQENQRHRDFIAHLRTIFDILSNGERPETGPIPQDHGAFTKLYLDDDFQAEDDGDTMWFGEFEAKVPKIDRDPPSITNEPTLEGMAVWSFLSKRLSTVRELQMLLQNPTSFNVDDVLLMTTCAIQETYQSANSLQQQYPGLCTADNLHKWLGVDIRESGQKFEVVQRGGGCLDRTVSAHDLMFTGSFVDVKDFLTGARNCTGVGEQSPAVDYMQEKKPSLTYASRENCVGAQTSEEPAASLCDQDMSLSATDAFWCHAMRALGPSSKSPQWEQFENLDILSKSLLELVTRSDHPVIPIWLPCAFELYYSTMQLLATTYPNALSAMLDDGSSIYLSCEVNIARMVQDPAYTRLDQDEKIQCLQSLPDQNTSRHCMMLSHASSVIQTLLHSHYQQPDIGPVLTIFPFNACLLRFVALVIRYQAGMEMCTVSKPVTYLSHLYTACFNFNLLSEREWSDMRFFIQSHPEKCRFLPSTNKSLASRRTVSSSLALALKHGSSSNEPIGCKLRHALLRATSTHVIIEALNQALHEAGPTQFMVDVQEFRRDAEFDYATFAVSCTELLHTISATPTGNSWSRVTFALTEASAIHSVSPNGTMRKDTLISTMASALCRWIPKKGHIGVQNMTSSNHSLAFSRLLSLDGHREQQESRSAREIERIVGQKYREAIITGMGQAGITSSTAQSLSHHIVRDTLKRDGVFVQPNFEMPSITEVGNQMKDGNIAAVDGLLARITTAVKENPNHFRHM